MQRGNRDQGRARGADDFFGFGDPFAGFPGFANPRSLMSSFFGRDAFNDPFFGNSLFSNDGFGDPFFSQSSFFSHAFNDPFLQPFGRANNVFIEDAARQVNQSNRGPVIRELSPDEEDSEENARADGTSTEPRVQDPDEADNVHVPAQRYVRQRSEYNSSPRFQPQSRSFSFQSSTVTYGGANGAYYTKSTMRKVGGNGVVEEEHKEADSTTGKATHRLSRGIRDKGHSVTRHLKSDGNVDTTQTLHNLNEDELDTFKKDWEGKAKRHLPGWNQGFDALQNGNHGTSQAGAGSSRRGWALPSNEQQPAAPTDHMRMGGDPKLRNGPSC